MLEAEMELINNEDSYNYDVTVSYKKEDNYRVSLRNKTNHSESGGDIPAALRRNGR